MYINTVFQAESSASNLFCENGMDLLNRKGLEFTCGGALGENYVQSLYFI